MEILYDLKVEDYEREINKPKLTNSDSHIKNIERKQRLKEIADVTLKVKRVIYGKDNVALNDQEFCEFNGSPVGTIKEIMEYAKKAEYKRVVFTDKNGLFMFIREVK